MQSARRSINHVALPLAILVMFVLAFLPVSASPQLTPLHVAPSGTDSASCGSQAQPCKTIQQALNNASGTTTIKVAQGTYTGTGSQLLNVQADYYRSLDVRIIGGYTTDNWDSPSTDATKTILSGQDARRVININATGESWLTLHLEGLSIQNGRVTSPGDITEPWYTGGGLLCRDNNQNKGKVAVSMTNVLFKSNLAQGTGAQNAIALGGGASFLYYCKVDLENVTFDNNRALGGNATDNTRGGQAVGGGLFTGNGTVVTAENLTLTNNLAQGGDGGTGFGWGTPDGLGGGAAFQLNSVNIQGVTATNNRAIGGGNTSQQAGTGSGGGLFFELNPGEIVIEDGLIEDNLAQGGAASAGIGGIASGGGLMSTDIALRLERIKLFDNQALGGNALDGGDAGGGALYFTKVHTDHTSTVTGINLILAGNKAEAGQGRNRWGGGGGIFSQDTTLTLQYATLSGNSVLNTMQGAAMVIQHNLTSSLLVLKNSLVANHDGRDSANKPRAPIVIQKAGDTGNVSYTLFHNNTQDYNTGSEVSYQPGLPPSTINLSNLLTGDPLFVNMGSNDYRLNRGSAAINKASGTDVPLDIARDPRPYGSASDVGAYEWSPALKLAVASVTSGELNLVWSVDSSRITDIANFKINYTSATSASHEPTVEVVVDGSKRTQIITGLTDGTTYDFIIQAVNANGGVLSTSSVAPGTPMANHVFIPVSLR